MISSSLIDLKKWRFRKSHHFNQIFNSTSHARLPWSMQNWCRSFIEIRIKVTYVCPFCVWCKIFGTLSITHQNFYVWLLQYSMAHRMCMQVLELCHSGSALCVNEQRSVHFDDVKMVHAHAYEHNPAGMHRDTESMINQEHSLPNEKWWCSCKARGLVVSLKDYQ